MILDHPSGNRCSGVYRGIVKKHLPHGKCKIWIPGVYPEEFENKPECLPDAEQAAPLMGGGKDGNGVFSYPNIGAIVLCRFFNDDVNYPVFTAQTQGGENAFGQYELVFSPGEEQSSRHLITSGKSHFEMYEDGRISSIVVNPDLRTAKVDYRDDLEYPDSQVSSRPIWEFIDDNQISHVAVQHVMDNDAGYMGIISSGTHFYNINSSQLCVEYYGPSTIENAQQAAEWTEANEKGLLSSQACTQNSSLKAGVQAIASSVKALAKVAEMGGDIAKKANDFCISAVQQLNEIAKFDLSASNLSAGIGQVVNKATKTVENAVGSVSNLASGVMKGVGAGVQSAGSAIGDAIGSAGSSASSLLNKLGSPITAAPDSVASGVKSVVGSVSDFAGDSLEKGGQVVDSITDAAQSGVQSVEKAASQASKIAMELIQGALDSIEQAIKAITPDGGKKPSGESGTSGQTQKPQQTVNQNSQNTSNAVEQNDDMLETIRKNIEKLVEGAADILKDAATQVKDMTSNAWGSVSGTAGDLFDTTKDVFGKACTCLSAGPEKLVDGISNTVDKIGDMAGSVGDKIGDMAGSVGDKIGDMAGSVGDKLGGFFGSVTGVMSDAAESVEKFFNPSELSADVEEFEDLYEDEYDEYGEDDIDSEIEQFDSEVSADPIKEKKPGVKPYYYYEVIPPDKNSADGFLSSQIDNYDVMRNDGVCRRGTISAYTVEKCESNTAFDGSTTDIEEKISGSVHLDSSTCMEDGFRSIRDLSAFDTEQTISGECALDDSTEKIELKRRYRSEVRSDTDLGGESSSGASVMDSTVRRSSALSVYDGSYDNKDLTSSVDYSHGQAVFGNGVKILSSKYDFRRTGSEDTLYLSGDMLKNQNDLKTTKSDMFLMNNNGLNMISSGIKQRAERDGVKLDAQNWSILTTTISLTNDIQHRQELGDVSDFYVVNTHTLKKTGVEAFGDLTENQWPIYIERLSTKYIGKDFSYGESSQKLNSREFEIENNVKTDCQTCVVYFDYKTPDRNFISGCLSSEKFNSEIAANHDGRLEFDFQHKKNIASSYVDLAALSSANLDYRSMKYIGDKYSLSSGFLKLAGYTDSYISNYTGKYDVIPLVPGSGTDFVLCNITANIQNNEYMQGDLFRGGRMRHNVSSIISDLQHFDVDYNLEIMSSHSSCDGYDSRIYGQNFNQINSSEIERANMIGNTLSSLSSYIQGRRYFDPLNSVKGDRFSRHGKHIYQTYDTRSPHEIGENYLSSYDYTQFSDLSQACHSMCADTGAYWWHLLSGLHIGGTSSIYENQNFDGSGKSGFAQLSVMSSNIQPLTFIGETSSSISKTQSEPIIFDSLRVVNSMDISGTVYSVNSCDGYYSRLSGNEFRQYSSVVSNQSVPGSNIISALSTCVSGRQYFNSVSAGEGSEFSNQKNYTYGPAGAPYEIGSDYMRSYSKTQLHDLSSNGVSSMSEVGYYRWDMTGVHTGGTSAIYDHQSFDGTLRSGFRKSDVMSSDIPAYKFQYDVQFDTTRSIDGSTKVDQTGRTSLVTDVVTAEDGFVNGTSTSSDGSYSNTQDIYSIVGNSNTEITTMTDYRVDDLRSVMSGMVLLSGLNSNKQIVRQYKQVPVDPTNLEGEMTFIPIDVETPLIDRGSSVKLGFGESVEVAAEAHDRITTISCSNRMTATQGVLDMRIQNVLGGTVCYLTMDAFGNITMSNNMAGLNCVKMDPAGNIYVQSTAAVNIKSPNVNITGATKIDGTCTITGATSIQGTCAVTGAVTCNSTVTATDCLAAGVSLVGHTHQTSMGPTSPPR